MIIAKDCNMPDIAPTAVLPPDLHYVDDTQPGITRKKQR